MTELVCRDSRLLVRLGAVSPDTREQHRLMRERGDLVVRCVPSGPVLFWPLAPALTLEST